VIHDGSDEVTALFPNTKSGKQSAGGHVRHADKHRNTYGKFKGNTNEGDVLYGDQGSASRFFYCAKTNRQDRNAGDTKNDHPTVKPTELMRYLCRLVTPPGGTVLDPFMGSGSTGRGAVLEGLNFHGIEQDLGYFNIAKARIADAADSIKEDQLQLFGAQE
jgi:site-specific DNA-methyltransferase (adenine-specific)